MAKTHKFLANPFGFLFYLLTGDQAIPLGITRGMATPNTLGVSETIS